MCKRQETQLFTYHNQNHGLFQLCLGPIPFHTRFLKLTWARSSCIQDWRKARESPCSVSLGKICVHQVLEKVKRKKKKRTCGPWPDTRTETSMVKILNIYAYMYILTHTFRHTYICMQHTEIKYLKKYFFTNMCLLEYLIL